MIVDQMAAQKLSNISLVDLQRMIRARRTQLARLEKRRSGLLKRVDVLDAQISELGGEAQPGRRGGARSRRARNSQSLPDAIHAVLAKASGPVAVGDIAARVHEGGYRSTSTNFRGIVNQTLVKDSRFKSVARGMYQLKPGGRKKRAVSGG